MRNLKKVLSLALALVMLVGMMVVGAGATSFADDASIQNQEAVSVLAGLGVVKGREDGSNFDPTGTLTRAEAAMMIAQLDLGVDAAAALTANGTNPFTDVAATHWAAGAIDYCVEQGYIRGDGNRHFFPGNNVTGVEFSIMLASLLGYDAKAEGLLGADWQSKGAALARRAGLTNGVTAGTADMTRDGMAQMAFNALTADMVDYPNGTGTSIDLGGIGSITTGAKAEPITHKSGDKLYTDTGVGSATTSDPVKLCEEKFPQLKLNTSDEDAFKRDASTWSYDGTAVFTKANTANLTYTNETSATAIAKDLKAAGVVADSTGIASIKNGTVALAADIKGADLAATAGTINTKTDPGVKVEVYIDATNKKIDSVIITEYTVEELQSITEKKDSISYKFSVTGTKTNDEDNTRVIFEGAVDKDDVVTTATDKDGALHVYPTTSFDGNQTSKKTSSGVTTLTVGGEQYVLATGVNKAAATPIDAGDFANSKDDATYFVDVNGYIVAQKGAAAPAKQYAVIASVAATASGVTLDNPVGYTVKVRAALADGSIADYDLAVAQTTDDDQWGLTGGSNTGYLMAGSGSVRVPLCASGRLESYLQTDVSAALADKVFAYTINDDGQMVISAMAPAASMSTSATDPYLLSMANSYKGATSHAGKDTSGDSYNKANQSGTTGLFNSKTVFVIYNVDAQKKVTAEAHTGISGLPINTSSGVNGGLAVIKATAAAQGTASVVFLKTTVEAPTKDYVYVDPASKVSVLKEDGSGSTWQFTGYTADGETIDVTHGDGSANSDLVTAKGLYQYNSNNVLTTNLKNTDDSTAIGPAAANSFNHLTNVSSDGTLIQVGSDWIAIPEDVTPIYVKDGVDEFKNVNCFVALDADKNVSAIFIFEKADTRAAAGTIPNTVTYASGSDIHLASPNGTTAQASGATLQISLADDAATADEVVLSDVDSKLSVTKGTVTGASGSKTLTLQIAAGNTATTAGSATFKVKVTAHDSTTHKDTEVKTITVTIAKQPDD